MLAALHMDITGQRVPMAVVACLLQVIVGTMLVIPSLPFAGTFFAFYLDGKSLDIWVGKYYSAAKRRRRSTRYYALLYEYWFYGTLDLLGNPLL